MFFLQVMLSFWQKIEDWDQWVFIKLNSQLVNPFFDSVMPYFRSSQYWAPLYLFLFIFVVTNFKGKGLWWSLLFLCTVSLTDIVSSRVFKEAFERARPCQDPDFIQYVRLLVNRCSGGYGFTSSHAANHFGMATYFFITFRHILKKWAWIAWVWASLVGYAQIYVGVHYPTDIIGGAILGVIFGTTLGLFFNKRFGFAIFDK